MDMADRKLLQDVYNYGVGGGPSSSLEVIKSRRPRAAKVIDPKRTQRLVMKATITTPVTAAA